MTHPVTQPTQPAHVMRPLRLTWHLAAPLAIGGNPIHLDSLLGFAVTESRLRQAINGEADAPSPSTRVRDLAKQLPLAVERRGELSVWKASALVPVTEDAISGAAELGGHGMRFWTRKTDAYDYADRVHSGQMTQTAKTPMKPYALKIDLARGLLKQQFKHFPVKQISALQAWCVGDIDAIQALLDPEWGSPITHIGPRGRSGFGAIRAFEIVEDEAANHRWQDRVLPWPADGAVATTLATQMPYWEVENLRPAYVKPELFL